MKTVTGKLVLFALTMMTIGASACHAQIANHLDFKAAQPFTVGNTTLAAGSYTIRLAEFDSTIIEIASTAAILRSWQTRFLRNPTPPKAPVTSFLTSTRMCWRYRRFFRATGTPDTR